MSGDGVLPFKSLGKDTVMIRRIAMAAAIGSLALSAAACNTVKGVGEDIQSVGEEGEEVIN